ncbi:hypothetical protein H6G45_19055 [Synechocystis sp. FACHB-383]|uniref:hypothetical protein n=1 Tax=Synechocystis sp. FACHB-383 TaxID=2692864 RepID=UPI001987F0AA|nr:hypothetical protein [Synechocystis sp. FACHB-383]MBD2655528.1 hypothetical protein [Synechocystis sp. FACHB-383]
MTFLAFLVPIFTFYALLLISLAAGLAAFVGAFISRRRHRWVLVAGLSAVLLGSLVNYYYRGVLWGAASWFTAVGLAPIALGSMGLVRWLLLKPEWGQ